MTYGIALIEKEGVSGLTLPEIKLLYGLTTDVWTHYDEVYPIELEARNHECSAMGFIRVDAAKKLNYNYELTGLHDYIASILDDMNLEHEDHKYQFKGIDIWLSR